MNYRRLHRRVARVFLLAPLTFLIGCAQLTTSSEATIVGTTPQTSATTRTPNDDIGSMPTNTTEPMATNTETAEDATLGAATPLPSAVTSAGVSQELPAGARCYVDAVNAERLDDLVACFAPDGVVVDVSRRIAGADAIRTWADREVIGGRLEVLALDQQRPGHVRLLVHWAPEGSAGWRAYYTFDEQNGPITQADLQYV